MTRVAKFVALETSSEWCSVALSLDGEISSRERRAGQRHSELALPMLFELLRDTSLKIEDIEAVAYGAGPGSFTGLRIACGLAQGLALARGLPVIGISSLEAIAQECGAPRVVACIDARMREVYYSALEREAAAGRGLDWLRQRLCGVRTHGLFQSFCRDSSDGGGNCRARRTAPRARRGRRCSARRAHLRARQGGLHAAGAGEAMSAVLKELPE